MMAGNQTTFDSEDAEVLLNQLRGFQDTLRQEWSRVLNQWGNLKYVWRDQQFDKFEPLFEKFSATYDDAERECGKYIAFIEEQMRINEERKQQLSGRLGDL
jgi:hypothetical protein